MATTRSLVPTQQVVEKGLVLYGRDMRFVNGGKLHKAGCMRLISPNDMHDGQRFDFAVFVFTNLYKDMYLPLDIYWCAN